MEMKSFKTSRRPAKLFSISAGDTGASNEGKYGHEVSVADQMTTDCRIVELIVVVGGLSEIVHDVAKVEEKSGPIGIVGVILPELSCPDLCYSGESRFVRRSEHADGFGAAAHLRAEFLLLAAYDYT
jgi:hypothetical protein